MLMLCCVGWLAAVTVGISVLSEILVAALEVRGTAITTRRGRCTTFALVTGGLKTGQGVHKQ